MNKAPTVEEWLFKVLEIAEVAKLSALIKDKPLMNLRTIWKLLLDFLLHKPQHEPMGYGFEL